MKKCPRCGYIHWEESPILEETAEWAIANAPVTTRDVADEFGISLQNARNRLEQVADLGLLKKRKRAQPSGGYVNEYHVGDYKPPFE